MFHGLKKLVLLIMTHIFRLLFSYLSYLPFTWVLLTCFSLVIISYINFSGGNLNLLAVAPVEFWTRFQFDGMAVISEENILSWYAGISLIIGLGASALEPLIKLFWEKDFAFLEKNKFKYGVGFIGGIGILTIASTFSPLAARGTSDIRIVIVIFTLVGLLAWSTHVILVRIADFFRKLLI